jgi:hypothetical protein
MRRIGFLCKSIESPAGPGRSSEGALARKTEKPLSGPTAALLDLGFTETEAVLYGELLISGPATGYRLAGAVGKAAPNVYQALESLFSKGAVMATEGRTRVFRATPVDEFLAALDTDFRGRRTAARAALSQLAEPRPDDRLYQLKTVDQVFERARAMIDGSKQIVLHDLFPAPYSELADELHEAVDRGVSVAGIDYAGDASSADPQGASSGIPWDRWPGQQISIVIDAQESLYALLSRDGKSVLRGHWTNSAYISCLNHSGLACLIHVARALPGALPEPIASIGLLAAYPPGLKALLGEVETPAADDEE